MHRTPYEGIDFVDFDIFYDDNSNITRTEDNIYPAGFDVAYDLDGMNRLTQATEGTWIGSISSKTREELYTLDQVGNFEFFKRDLNGDGLFTGTDEWDDDRTHNKVNELTARDIDDDGTNNYSLVYDAVGNMTDDGESYEFVYDVWGRLRKITTRGTSPRLVAEYEYYGNNYRASAHYDTNIDGSVNSSDKTYYFAYNERWQMMAVYRDTDSDPKEQFVYHLAGNSGHGSSSYIDQVILRDRDDTNGWTGAADGTFEERIYYCQNWRFDVVALVTNTGELAERARYSPYGVPFGMPLGDVNGDGSVSGTDTGIILGDYSSSNWRSDLNLDGVIDSADHTIANNNFGAAGGREVLSDIGNRRGYAAYEYAFIGESLYHVRNWVYRSDMGMWIRRGLQDYVPSNSYQPSGTTSSFVAGHQSNTACKSECHSKYPVGTPELEACIIGCDIGTETNIICFSFCSGLDETMGELFSACMGACEGTRHWGQNPNYPPNDDQSTCDSPCWPDGLVPGDINQPATNACRCKEGENSYENCRGCCKKANPLPYPGGTGPIESLFNCVVNCEIDRCACDCSDGWFCGAKFTACYLWCVPSGPFRAFN